VPTVFLPGIAVALLLLLIVAWREYVVAHLPELEARYGVPVDFATLRRTPEPHDYLLADPGDAPHAAPDAAPLLLRAPPAEVADRIARLFEGKMLTRSADGRSFALLDRTKLLGFPDFVTLAVRDDAAGTRVLAYSRSVYGRSDLGKNRARLQRWMQLIAADVTSARTAPPR
jgi:Protein of unknown function (DUF1499)